MSIKIKTDVLKEQSKDLIGEPTQTILSKFKNNQIDESLFIYLVELRNNPDHIESIEQIEDTSLLYGNKRIKSTDVLDEDEIETRKEICNSLGITFELRPHLEVISELDGCVIDIKDKIDPVNVIRNIRENWGTELD